MGLYDFTLHNIISRNAECFGDKTAFVHDDERITHREYKDRVDRPA